MPAEAHDSDGATLDTSRLMLGVLALLAEDRDERVDGLPPRRSELVLADAGFSAQEIAKLTGRNYEAVRSSLRRHAQPKTTAKGRTK
jgi:DNA-directed RNA polymerase specialized sigma24 family protein